MNPPDEFRKHAAECMRMAASTRDAKEKASWTGLAQRWTACAAVSRPAMRSRGNRRARRLRTARIPPLPPDFSRPDARRSVRCRRNCGVRVQRIRPGPRKRRHSPPPPRRQARRASASCPGAPPRARPSASPCPYGGSRKAMLNGSSGCTGPSRVASRRKMRVLLPPSPSDRHSGVPAHAPARHHQQIEQTRRRARPLHSRALRCRRRDQARARR